MKPIRRVAFVAIAVSAFILGSSEPAAAGPPDHGACILANVNYAICLLATNNDFRSCGRLARDWAYHCYRPQ
jgi:hypothetical protein